MGWYEGEYTENEDAKWVPIGLGPTVVYLVCSKNEGNNTCFVVSTRAIIVYASFLSWVNTYTIYNTIIYDDSWRIKTSPTCVMFIFILFCGNISNVIHITCHYRARKTVWLQGPKAFTSRKKRIYNYPLNCPSPQFYITFSHYKK